MIKLLDAATLLATYLTSKFQYYSTRIKKKKKSYS